MCENNLYGDIIPGKCIGDFEIGSSYEQVLSKKLIVRDTSNKKMPDNVVHEVNKNIVFFINNNNRIQEIVAKNNYKGRVNNLFGIGDRLIDFKDRVKYETSIYDSEGFFYFPDMPGLRVLADKWDEDGTGRIQFIYIYDIVLGSEF